MLRSAVSAVLKNSSTICGASRTRPVLSTLLSQSLPATVTRSYSYEGSPMLKDVEKPTDFEKSYEEWKWVERLIPPETVPQAPTDPSIEYPSGWKAPNPPKHCGYVVRRNKNHLIPIYTIIKDRGQTRETRIRHVEGDIWSLEKDVGKFLKKLYPKRVIMTYTQETYRFVGIRGDHTEDLKEWLLSRGF